MLIQYRTYTTENSDLAVRILNIWSITDTYIKARVSISNKKNHIVYEVAKNYRIPINTVKNWIKLHH